MRYVEVCAGAGGLGLGLHRAGWTGTGLELDADACATHRANVGPCLQADVTLARAPHDADLVAGGVPCTTFSTAGNQEGLNDPRGQLFRSLLRIAGEANARCVLMENVRAFVSMGALPVALAAFQQSGYEPVFALLNAADYGVPQNRVRLFIVGFRDPSARSRFQWPRATHGPGTLFAHVAAPLSVRNALGLKGDLSALLDQPSPTVTGAGNDMPFADVDVRDRWREALRPAIGTREGEVRLSVAQCATLQSFPPGFQVFGGIRSRYLQIGNAVPPLLAEHLGCSIAHALYDHDRATQRAQEMLTC